MMTLAAANRLIDERLGDTPRAQHSREVGRLMSALAKSFAGDEVIWAIIGLCHDLDYFAVAGDWSRHGILTGEWLAGQLPLEALRAVAAHDHRTGVSDDSVVADMLKLADTLANIGQHAGYAALRTETQDALRLRLGRRSYLVDMLERLTAKHGLDTAALPI